MILGNCVEHNNYRKWFRKRGSGFIAFILNFAVAYRMLLIFAQIPCLEPRSLLQFWRWVHYQYPESVLQSCLKLILNDARSRLRIFSASFLYTSYVPIKALIDILPLRRRADVENTSQILWEEVLAINCTQNLFISSF